MAAAFVSHWVTGSASIAAWFGMVGFLLTERYFIETTIEKAKTEIINSIKIDLATKELNNIQDALNYIRDNASKCKKNCNTRLFSETSEPSHTYARTEFNDHDDAIILAIKNGCECYFIVAANATSGDYFGKFRNIQPLGNEKIKGQFVPKVLNTEGKPMLQITLLEYHSGECEAIVGCEANVNRTANTWPIILFTTRRHTPTWEFFRQIFDIYDSQAVLIP